jgi:hypothetical protein
MSKRTSIYAAYTMTEQDFDLTALGNLAAADAFLDTGRKLEDEPERNLFALGMKHKF